MHILANTIQITFRWSLAGGILQVMTQKVRLCVTLSRQLLNDQHYSSRELGLNIMSAQVG